MKLIKTTIAAALMSTMLTGCIGQMATTSMVMYEVNLKGVDNRYARAGLYTLMSPVYAITAAADLFVINSIEFWTGTNPLTKKKAVADTPAEAYIKVNHKVGKKLSTAPVKLSKLDDNTTQMDFIDDSGKARTLVGVSGKDSVDFYLDGEFITTASHAELEQYATAS
ncbi:MULTISPECIES: DUF3332 domain-containing protein [Vibrio]|jgi:hypothetical protein|uniref:DUF3332 family protein n=1 Tax=Vibrio mediterranei TaxID=689 RepID=A0A2S9ZJD4_9VIBR|nr:MULTISPECIES: DUF3332 domain-containing protein [Vibrio]AYV20678.1 DUF3332 family protein [Vibrio mediterranei]MCF4175125.1 DUF3332 domain-containing protein [Vibrio sp. McD22-P3]MCG9657862.1 DUF3332 domain-containing protein [Vibrio mediterranei]MCG9662374.1 DUF3332 domain-containing protein [Vibrio mediterranei]MDA0110820.1 DUF3332 domain-containing protein [Vibrio sp. La 4.2.2]